MSQSETNLLTPDKISSAIPAAHPQKLHTTYHLTHSNVLSDEDDDNDFFQSYSYVLVGKHKTELVDPVVRNGKTEFYGRAQLREDVPTIQELEDFKHFHQYLIRLGSFQTLDSFGSIASGVQAIKSWNGFAIESNSFRVLWVNLGVVIQSDDDEWNIHGRRITELIYSASQESTG